MKDRDGTRFHINNSERAQQIDDDKALNILWRNSQQSKVNFIRDNRQAIDAAVRDARNKSLGKTPPGLSQVTILPS
jgi:hypothetical protein